MAREVVGHDNGVVCGRLLESQNRAKAMSAPSSRAGVQKLRNAALNHVAEVK